MSPWLPCSCAAQERNLCSSLPQKSEHREDNFNPTDKTTQTNHNFKEMRGVNTTEVREGAGGEGGGGKGLSEIYLQMEASR